MHLHPSPGASWALPLWALLVAVHGTGCASLNKEPTVEVRATRNPLAPPREQRTYTLACSNQVVQQWFLSDRAALLALAAALEKLGYEEAADPALARYHIIVELGFATRPSPERIQNPDSIRYQNVAAIIGEGRYRQILTERDDASGSLLVGPNGEMIPTGGWKQVMADSEPREFRAAGGSHDAMIFRAWDVGASPDRILAWEVIVLRTNDSQTPSPRHVAIMIRHAAERLAAGWPDGAAVGEGAAEKPATRDPAPPPAAVVP